MSFKPTEEQIYPVDLIKRGNSTKIIAYAGTGKSTTLNYAARTLDRSRILYVTFGKENIKEARRKFPGHVTCSTAHALAFQYINQQINISKRNLLTPTLSIEALMRVMKVDLNDYQERESVLKPISVAVSIINNFCKTTDSSIQKKHGLQVSGEVSNLIFQEGIIIARNYWNQAISGNAPLTHDMYLKMWQLSDPILNYDIIMFDEAQDADALMADVINKQDCLKMVVGDHHQQIYSFRGAVNALKIFDIDDECFITQSFRYGPRTAELANQLLYHHKGINAGIKGNPGLDTRFGTCISGKRAVIGRSTLELFNQMNDLVLDGFDDFSSLADIKTIKEVIYNLYILRNPDKKDANGNPLKVTHPFLKGFSDYREFVLYSEANPDEVFATYDAILSNCRHTIKKIIRRLSSPEKGSTVFLTAHKCKGLEFDNVVLTNDFRSPGDETYNEEETNLLYVAATRGVERLDFTNNDILTGLPTVDAKI